MRTVTIMIILLMLGQAVTAVPMRFKGRVTNTKLEPLSYVTVQIKKIQIGTRTNDLGEFGFNLEPGDYEFVFSLVGYQTLTVPVVLQENQKEIRNIILEEVNQELNAVRITSYRKDRAEELIRKVIANKEKNLLEQGNYTCELYIKATEESEFSMNERKQKKKRKNKEKEIVALSDSLQLRWMQDSIQRSLTKEMNSMSLTEIILTLDVQYPDKVKETRTGVKKRGQTSRLFYLSTTDGNFSLYPNRVSIPALSELPFLSPLSFSGLIGYHYKITHTEKRTGYTQYTIRFTPIKAGNALLEGEMDVIDTSWAVTRVQYTFPKHLMAEYDYFEVEIDYDRVQERAWMPTRMELDYTSKHEGTLSHGVTRVHYDKYVLDTTFKKKHFNAEIGSTSLEAYERDTNFWNVVRKEPLSEKELKFIRYKDSVYDYTHTEKYLDSVDKEKNKVTFRDIILDGIDFSNHRYQRQLSLNAITSMYQPFYPGGSRLGYGASYSRVPKNKKSYSVSLNLAYSPKHKDLVGYIHLWHRYNPFNHGYVMTSFGHSYDLIFSNDSYINVLRRSNFFIKDYIKAEHGIELLNGLFLRNRVELALRKPIQVQQVDSTFDNILSQLGANSWQFDYFNPYGAFYNFVSLEFTPKQLYLREPRQKVILGSKYPTFFASWRKGIPNVFNSKIDFDYVEGGLFQRFKIGLLGVSDYKVFLGSFLTQKRIKTIDNKFIRRGDPILFYAPNNNFQALDSTFALRKVHLEGHYLHEFMGSVINKIPHAKKLKLTEIAGGGILYAPERNLRYLEVFVGLEKQFKLFGNRMKFGLYGVGSAANKENMPFQFKIGLQSYNEERNRWE